MAVVSRQGLGAVRAVGGGQGSGGSKEGERCVSQPSFQNAHAHSGDAGRGSPAPGPHLSKWLKGCRRSHSAFAAELVPLWAKVEGGFGRSRPAARQCWPGLDRCGAKRTGVGPMLATCSLHPEASGPGAWVGP